MTKELDPDFPPENMVGVKNCCDEQFKLPKYPRLIPNQVQEPRYIVTYIKKKDNNAKSTQIDH